MNLSQSYSYNPNLLNDLDSLTAPKTDADAILQTLNQKAAECMPDIGDTTYTLSYLSRSTSGSEQSGLLSVKPA